MLLQTLRIPLMHGAAVCRESANDVCNLPIGDIQNIRDYGLWPMARQQCFRMCRCLVDIFGIRHVPVADAVMLMVF